MNLTNTTAGVKERLMRFFPITLLMILVLVFFSRIIFSGKCLFGSDFVLYFHPVKKFIQDTVLNHHALPFWNPFLFAGMPFISNIQASMFYPLGVLFYVMPVESAYLWTIIIHCVLGSMFMYLFMRVLRISRSGAFLAATIFIFNGYFMAHLYAGHLSFIQSYIWIPLIFCLLHQFVKTSQFKWVLFASLSLGIQILGGFPQITFYTIVATLSFGLFHAGLLLKAKDLRLVTRTALGLVSIIVIGFCLAAIQLLPTLELTGLSGRAGGVSYYFATFDSLHPKMLLSFVIPDIFGSAADQTFWINPTRWHFWETCGYIGILPLILIFVPMPKANFSRNIKYFFLGVVFMALFLALGKYNPVYPLIFKLPGFHSFRIPAQILFLYVFAIAAISGIALDHAEEGLLIISRPLVISLLFGTIVLVSLLGVMHFEPYIFFKRLFMLLAEQPVDQDIIGQLPAKLAFSMSRSAMLFFLLALLFLLFKRSHIGTTSLKMAIVAIVIIDLGLYSYQFVKTVSFSEQKQQLINRLQLRSGTGRIMTLNGMFRPNDGARYGFASIDGYDPLVLGRYLAYLQESQQLPQDREVITTTFLKNPDSKLLKMLSLQYIAQNGIINETQSFLPRCLLAKRALIKPATEILGFMSTDRFDPLTTVVFEPGDLPTPLISAEGLDFQGSCFITQYANEKIQIRASCNQPCYLVLSEVFYPGWHAKVDGIEVPVLRGDYLFRVVPLTQGNHEIVMHFVSVPFRIGAAISLITLLGCGLALWFTRRLSKRATRKNT